MKPAQLIDQKFGNLTVIDIAYKKYNKQFWNCSCNCNHPFCFKKHITNSQKLLSGKSTKCRAGRIHSHDKSETLEYKIWCGMKRRCTKKSCKDYPNYGGRGISYDPKWEYFEQFFLDMGLRPSSKHLLERKNNNENYSKENCMWALRSQQNSNKRNVGASFSKRHKKWCASVSKNYIKYWLGYFDSKEEAIEVYRQKRKELYPNIEE